MCEFLALNIKTYPLVIIFIIFKIGENELSGEIPSEIGNLVLLENFDAGENNLVGTIPTQFGNVTTIKIVDLGMYFNK